MSGYLKITIDGTKEFICQMLEEEAPDTCSRIRGLLPIRGTLIHGALSGPEVFVEIDASSAIRPENWTTHVIPGDVGYYYQAAGMVNRPRDMAEICMFYDRGGAPRSPEGPAPINLFARIEGSLYELAEACRAVRSVGPCSIEIDEAP